MPERVQDEPVVKPETERRFVSTHAPAAEPPVLTEPIFDVRDVAVFYGDHRAVTDITLALARNQITALTPARHMLKSASDTQRACSFCGTPFGSGGFVSQLNSVTQNRGCPLETTVP